MRIAGICENGGIVNSRGEVHRYELLGIEALYHDLMGNRNGLTTRQKAHSIAMVLAYCCVVRCPGIIFIHVLLSGYQLVILLQL